MMDDRCRHDLLIGYCKQCVIDGLEARVEVLELRVYQMGEFAKDELNYEIEDLERMAATRRPKMPDQSGKGERSQ